VTVGGCVTIFLVHIVNDNVGSDKVSFASLEISNASILFAIGSKILNEGLLLFGGSTGAKVESRCAGNESCEGK
jgi:hypothetical protein